ncbi:helix-turn-helix domain-containing protein [Ruegeria arenilitoris]|uniref:helix-turn-helix domain-containing protein n=1 Tax=Ruegeria arenilitoris TaxID=1173585 RepID=UPI0014809063|nr:helix-turn-helix transcriptional regulator [Ruegeria arenilitoris]
MNPDELIDKLAELRSGLKDHLDRNAPKRNLALECRAARKKAGVTREQVAERSGLSLADIDRLEATSGSFPERSTVMRFMAVCR